MILPKKQDKIIQNKQLLNYITPPGLKFLGSRIEIGGSKGCVYGIIKYPVTMDVGWLSEITNIKGCMTAITFDPASGITAMDYINRNIANNRTKAITTKSAIERQRAERAAADGEDLIKNIDQHGDVIGEVSILIMPYAEDEKTLQEITKKLRSVLTGRLGCAIRPITFLQKEGFQSILPYYAPHEAILNITNRVMPLTTYQGGLGFASEGTVDKKGYYFGATMTGKIVSLDTDVRSGDRANGNWVIMGQSGQGKSSALKHIITAEYGIKGATVIVIDPEREFRDLTRQLGGDCIDVGGGSGGLINPLQIKSAPVDDEGEKTRMYSEGSGDMALHIQTLEVFFNLYLPEMTDIQMSLLKCVLVELYGKYGISWETKVKDIPNDKFPVFENLYDLLVVKSKDKDELESAGDYKILAHLLQETAEGSMKFLWNGATTIDPKSKFICLDTHNIQQASERVKKTQYFNVLTWAWERMSRDRNEKVLLVCDEAYLMIDPKVPQSLVFLRNVSKRARKYKAGLAIVSHSVVDFLDPAIKMYGQALLDMPTYKVLMGTDGKDFTGAC